MPGQFDVVVLGLSVTGLYAVREAARAGFSVLGVGAPGAPGLWSRHLAGRVAGDTAAGRVDEILSRFPESTGRKPVLIVTSDQDLEEVTLRAATLSRHVHLQPSYVDGSARRILEKDSFYRLCQSQGVSYPDYRSVRLRQLERLDNELRYPLMLKPSSIQDVKHLMAGKKGWIVRSRADLTDVLAYIPYAADPLLMQEIVPGPESNITLWCGYLDAAGKVRQRFTARKLRQYPSGFGSASLVQSETCEETADIAEGLLRKLGYAGIAAAEFKRDPASGDLRIIEINPRPSLWFSLATASGVPLLETLIADAQGEALPAPSVQKDGVLWRYGLKDLASRLFYRTNPDFVLPAPEMARKRRATGRADVTFAWDDPGPGFGEAVNYARKFSDRLLARRGSGR